MATATFLGVHDPVGQSVCGRRLIAGNLSKSVRIGVDSDVEIVRQVTAVLHRLLPDLASFNLSIEAAHGLPLAASDLWLPVVYGVAYATIVLVCAVTVFERRDFK